MWLDELQLTDFRGFGRLKLDLRHRLTALIGVNGSGKTSLVDALRIVAAHSAIAAFQWPGGPLLTERDVRLEQSTCELRLAAGDLRLRLRRTAQGTTERDVTSLGDRAWPPLVIVFQSDRAVLRSSLAMGSRLTTRSKHPAWDDERNDAFTTFEQGEEWFRQREDLENQERVRRKQLDYVDQGLELARRSIVAMLPRYRDPHIDRSRPLGPATSQLVLSKGDQELTADMLSDGERSLLVIAMTIARRLSLLPPELASSEHVATVVIDEVELHLHPKWQRTIVPSLLRAFPSCQFVVTTHSPQVIGSVPHESLILLEDFEIHDAPAPTEGRDSNAILEEIMGASERSDDSRQELDRLAELVDFGGLDEAQVAVDELARRWGEDDREVVRLRTALRFREL
ncbi:MAG: AAA family ATPase [Myxococcales bacterium]|nr:AAA family ATPase [Myxococcales bacterium]